MPAWILKVAENISDRARAKIKSVPVRKLFGKLVMGSLRGIHANFRIFETVSVHALMLAGQVPLDRCGSAFCKPAMNIQILHSTHRYFPNVGPSRAHFEGRAVANNWKAQICAFRSKFIQHSPYGRSIQPPAQESTPFVSARCSGAHFLLLHNAQSAAVQISVHIFAEFVLQRGAQFDIARQHFL